MNKTILTLQIFILYFFCVNAQDPIPNFIPPSPNAASIAKFGDVPVSYYTGTPNISVPLYELKSDHLSLPMSVSYHAGGIRVDEIAGHVGLGWSLNAGGVITRTIRGLRDEKSNWGFLDLCSAFQVCSNDDLVTWIDDEDVLRKINDRKYDSQADLFYYNIPGASGKFVFDLNGDIHSIPKNNLRFEVDSKQLNYFTITTTDGTKYLFKDQENSHIETFCGPGDPVPSFHVSAWYLSEVIHPKKDTISLEYESYTVSAHPIGISQSKYQSATFLTTNPCNPCETSTGSGFIQTCTTYATNYGLHLKKITTRHLSAEFHYTQDRNDLPGAAKEVKLNSIEVKGALGDLLQTISFTYNNGSRLKLKEIQTTGSDGTPLPAFKFDYLDELGNPDYILPPRLSNKQDHWGFYNDNPHNSTFLHQSAVHPSFWNLGDRTPDTARTKAALIKKITYPTGGYTDFEFEAHRYGALHNLSDTVCELVPIEIDHTIKACLTEDENENPHNCDNPPGLNPFLCHIPADSFVFSLDQTVVANFSWAYFNYGTLTCCGGAGCPEICLGETDLFFELEHTAPSGNVTIIPIVGGPTIFPAQSSKQLFPGEYKMKVSAGLHCDYGWLRVQIQTYEETCSQIGPQGRYAGGVRLKKITDNPVSGPSITRTFNYLKSDSSRSSGVLITEPRYLALVYNSRPSNGMGIQGHLCELDPCYNCPELLLTSSPQVPLGTTHGSHIGYTGISVTQNDGGVSEISYSFFPDTNSLQYPFGPATSRDWKRGHLLKQTNYNSQGIVVSEIQNTYDFRHDLTLENNASVSGAIVERYFKPSAVCELPIFAHRIFETEAYWFYLESTTETTYDLNGQNPVVTHTDYTYESDHMNLVQQSFYETNNTVSQITQYSFAQEALNAGGLGNSTSVLQTMIDSHMISLPIQTETSGTVVSGNRTVYKLHNGMVLPEKIYAIEGDYGYDLQATLFYDNPDAFPDRLKKNHYEDEEIYTWQDGLLTQKDYIDWTWTWDYYANSRLLEKATDIDGQHVIYSYDGLQRLDEISQRGLGGDTKLTTTIQYYYDGIGGNNSVVSTTSYSDNTPTQKLTEKYDGLGRYLSKLRNTGTVLNAVTYDGVGRKATEKNIGSGPITYSYEASPLSRLLTITNPDQTEVSFDYSSNSTIDALTSFPANSIFKKVTIDENGHASAQFTDVLDRALINRRYEIYPSTVDVLDTRYGYTAYGNIASVITPKGQTYLYRYDLHNRLEEKDIPGNGTTIYEYDQRDRLTRTVLPIGKSVENQYDDYDRIEKAILDNLLETPLIINQYYASNVSGAASKGKIEYQYVATLDPDNNAIPWILLETHFQYDEFGRNNFSVAENLLNGTDSIQTEYFNSDHVRRMWHQHTSDGGDYVIENEYELNDDLLPKANYFGMAPGLGVQPPTAKLNEMKYDSEDHLIRKDLFGPGSNEDTGPLQVIDYEYNIRGWLTDINDIEDIYGYVLEDCDTTQAEDPPCPSCDYSLTVPLDIGEGGLYVSGIYVADPLMNPVNILNDIYELPSFAGLKEAIEGYLDNNGYFYQGVYVYIANNQLNVEITQTCAKFLYLEGFYRSFFGTAFLVPFKQDCGNSTPDIPPGPGEPGFSELALADSICIACEKAGYRCDECPYWNLTPPSDTTTVCDGWGLDGLTDCEHMEEVCNRCLDLQFISCDTCPLGVKAAMIQHIEVLYDPGAVQAGNASIFKVKETSLYYPRKGGPEMRTHEWAILSDTIHPVDSPLTYPAYTINLTYDGLTINFNNQDTVLAMLEQDLQQEFATAGASAANQELYAQSVVGALSQPLGNNMIDSPDLSPDLGDCGGPCNPDLFAMRIYYDKKPPVLNPPAQKNGNISALVWGVHKHGWMGYGFKYDPFDRLKEATSALSLPTVDLDEGQYFDAKYSYDEDGNITRLHRWGITDTCVGGFGIQYDFEKLDDLTYVYDDTTNRLVNIQEVANVDGGYKGTGGNFSYDNAGNMTGDDGRDISALYNHLSLPYKLSGVGGNYKITYDAQGNKLYSDGPDGRIHYIKGLEFTNGVLTSTMHEEGRVLQVESDSFIHEFVLRDHLGNVRVVFNDQYPDGLIKEHLGEILQEHHYYPFGLEWGPVYGNPPTAGNSIPWYWQAGDDEHRYRYNGKEFHGHEINWLDYGARWYDATIGRFTGVDPIADEFPWVNPYNYAENEPVGSIDLWGLQRVKVNGNYLAKERNSARRKIAEAGAFLRFPKRAKRVGSFKSGSKNITSVSGRIGRHIREDTEGIRGKPGKEENAIRHALWSAKMTQEFGVTGANEIGKAHEGIGPYDNVEAIYDEPFEGTKSGADSTVDLLNNLIGQALGESNPDASTIQLGEAVLKEFKENGLFTVKVGENGNISITKQKLTQEQYNSALNALRKLDNNGFNEEERKKYD